MLRRKAATELRVHPSTESGRRTGTSCGSERSRLESVRAGERMKKKDPGRVPRRRVGGPQRKRQDKTGGAQLILVSEMDQDYEGFVKQCTL